MEVKELKDMLEKSGTSNRSKYVPWWEGNFNDFSYKYEVFSDEEIREIEACIESCGKEELTEEAGNYGYSLFQLLVWHNFYHAVEKILDEGKLEGEIDAADHGGRGITAFLLACCRGNYAMAQLLLKHGANVSQSDAKGNNGYHYLARARVEGLMNWPKCMVNSVGQRELIARLMDLDINRKNDEGMTPLQLLLNGDNTNCSYALTGVFLEKGAETDYVDENGNTLLLKAIYNNHMTAALRLMECGNMVNQPNKENITPMQLAETRYREELCIALRDHGATQFGDGGRVDINNLSRITGNAFARCTPEDQDNFGLAIYLADKLAKMIDPDDDDDMKYLINIMHSALLQDEKCRVLDVCHNSGIDFLAPIHTGGSVTCLRDKCLGGNYGGKTIKKFIELGVDMDIAVVQGKTPANIVAAQQARMMLGNQKDDYFEKAAEFFSRESMEQVDNTGTTAMHEAARWNHADMLKVMIEKGADVNVTQDEPAEAGNTPLHMACIYGNAEVVKLLLSSGADDALQNVNGEIPAHFAVMKKKFGGDLKEKERAAVLKELKTLDVARNDGMTPLMLLQFLDINTNITLLPIFLDKGVDVNRKDSRGNTALIYNTDNQCYKDTVKELIRAGADVNATNNDGNTALYFALRYGNQETARFLIKKGADYNHANNQGVTPVQLAVEKGYDTVLELMTDIQ